MHTKQGFSIQECLTKATQQLTCSPSAVLDSEILLAKVLNKNRAYLRAWSERVLNQSENEHFQNLLLERIKGTPIAYIIGTKEFWSHDFIVTPDVLIPRPETELLIESALEIIPTEQATQVADLGTGSGAIAITLGLERPKSTVLAIDYSDKALVIAKKNAAQLKAHNLRFLQSHWLDSATGTFDLIVSNPPYIDKNDPHLQQGDVRFEPLSALIADTNGLQDIQMIAEQAKLFLKKGAHIMLEHGFEQQLAVQKILQISRYSSIKTHKDLLGHPRVTIAQWDCNN